MLLKIIYHYSTRSNPMLEENEIILAASLEKSLMSFLGGVEMIKERSEETLRSLTKIWFKLNNEVGAFYDKNGF